MAAKTPTIEPFRSAGMSMSHQYRWRLRGRNGEIMATSEGYATSGSRNRAMKRLKNVVAAAVLVSE